MSNEPHITALVRADGSGEVVVDGEVSPVYADGIEGVRGAIIARVTEEAVALDRPVRVATTDLDGIYPLIVHPDGAVDSDGPVIPVGGQDAGGSAAADGDGSSTVDGGDHASESQDGDDGHDGFESADDGDHGSEGGGNLGDHDGDAGQDSAPEHDSAGAEAREGDGAHDIVDGGDISDGDGTSDGGGISDSDDGSDQTDSNTFDHESGDTGEHSGNDEHAEFVSGDSSPDEDARFDPIPDEQTDAAGSASEEHSAFPETSADDAAASGDSRRSDPVLIPPPPFGIEELAAAADPAPTDGFVAPPTRRSTFQSFEAVLGFPTEPRADTDDDDAFEAEPERAADAGVDATEADAATETDRVAETRNGFDVFAEGLTFTDTGTADQSRSVGAHRADTDLDLPAPGLNAFSPPAEPAAGDADDSAPTLDDFLQSRPSASVGPAKKGWQGLVTRVTGGLLSPKPGKAERAHRNAIERVQRSMKGPRTIVVLNPKGGAHKTTATLLIAATFGIHRGGSTLAWDNNETRGTLGWRAQPSRHSNTAVDLLRDLEKFADVKSARVGYLDSYVRAQGDAQFDVLASDEDAAASSTIDAAAFRSLHSTLSRFYRVLVIDTGNNMRASNWEAAVEAADQLVVVTTVNEETAASAAWLLDGLRQKGHQDKVSQAVTILSSPGDTVQPELTQRLHSHFAALTRVVLEVPYDPGFQSGGPLNVDVLAPQTREAWLQVTAAVADGL